MNNRFAGDHSQLRFTLRRWLTLSFAILTIIFTFPSKGQTDPEFHRFGLLGGLSFPKFVLAKADLNLTTHFALNYEFSLGLFWSIQELDGIYYFSRSEWSPYVGLGIQNWSFFGFSSTTNYNGVLFGNGSQAISITIPLGILYVAENGFAFDLSVAGDLFTNAPTGLQWKVIPEAAIALGYFF
jgi:hypothetical protein